MTDFHVQQETLDGSAAKVTPELAITTQDPVTRDDDRQWIRGTGVADRSGGLWTPDEGGQVAIADGLGVGNRE